MQLNVSPPIWQTYINTILNSLQSRKYCEAIMDDLLFTPSKRGAYSKIRRSFESFEKECIENIS